MKTAILKVAPGGEKLRFEVHSTPSRGHHSVQKWYMKTNHPVEAHRWTQALSKSIEWYKYKRDDSESRKSVDSDSNSVRPTLHRGSLSTSLIHRTPDGASAFSLVDGTGDEDEYGEPGMTNDSSRANLLDQRDYDDAERNDDSSAAESTERDRTPPHETNFELHGNSIAVQMELTAQLLSNLSLPLNAPTRTQELRTALKESFGIVQGMMNQYIEMSKEREEWWKTKLERERDRQKLWEESLQLVVKEGEDLERELRVRSRRRGSKFFDMNAGDGQSTLRDNKQSLPSLPSFTSEDEQESTYFSPGALASPDTKVHVGSPTSIHTPTPRSEKKQMPAKCPGEDDDIDTDDEDEFFDAIESNTLPNLVVHDSFQKAGPTETVTPEYDALPYAGYKNLRQRLPIADDNRPSTSLWSVLKHSIGKDLTKISFPVFFNEPTSMLQRMVGAARPSKNIHN
jgi:hypothetical protein